MPMRSLRERLALGAGAIVIAATLLTPAAFADSTPTPTTTATATQTVTATTTLTVTATTTPAATSTATATPTANATTCTSSSLAATVGLQGATGNLAGAIIFTDEASTPCTLQGNPTVQIVDANGNPLPITQSNTNDSSGQPPGIVTLQPQQQASVFLFWSNFCQSPAPSGPYSFKVALPNDGTMTIPASGSPGSSPLTVTPPCGNSSSPSTLQVGPFRSYSAAAHDNRYFAQTGFRIDNDTIWDYFNRRGGINVFGYPVSRAFTLQGFTVQFFQRRIVQLGPDGHARLLNTLDPGIMPYNSFNGAQMPSYDSTLVSSAPSPTDPAAVLAWIKTHAPDSFQGMPVNFYQTFANSVSYVTAFPNGGDAGLLPGFDLELWGIPTSNPTLDPNNHNFVYQRFQRGILMYDASCTCTQGVLLADYLKSILTGQNLPLDLAQEAQNSPFFHQYDPSQPNWVHNPSLLPNTDLTNAFTQE